MGAEYRQLEATAEYRGLAVAGAQLANGASYNQRTMAQPQQEMPPVALLFRMITGKWVSAAIGMVARFCIADHVKDGPKSVEELAALSKTHAPSLYRLLRATASLGIFAEMPDGRFAQTPLSDCLRTNSSAGVRNLAMFMLDEWHMRAWTEMPWAVETGKPATEKLFGMPGFDWMAQNPEQTVNFNNAMTDLSRTHAPVVASTYDFSGFTHLVDAGGGLGMLLAAILERNPALHATLCELPYVIEQASKGPILAPFAERCSFAAGNFLEAVPAGGDAYIMKHILHDWDDAHCTRILANIRRAIAPNGKLLVVDYVVGPGNTPDPAKLMDLEMLMIGGKERTETEWRELFHAGGFALQRVIPTPAGLCVIEGTPA